VLRPRQAGYRRRKLSKVVFQRQFPLCLPSSPKLRPLCKWRSDYSCAKSCVVPFGGVPCRKRKPTCKPCSDKYVWSDTRVSSRPFVTIKNFSKPKTGAEFSPLKPHTRKRAELTAFNHSIRLRAYDDECSNVTNFKSLSDITFYCVADIHPFSGLKVRKTVSLKFPDCKSL